MIFSSKNVLDCLLFYTMRTVPSTDYRVQSGANMPGVFNPFEVPDCLKCCPTMDHYHKRAGSTKQPGMSGSILVSTVVIAGTNHKGEDEETADSQHAERHPIQPR
jgi:hypothetical protein